MKYRTEILINIKVAANKKSGTKSPLPVGHGRVKPNIHATCFLAKIYTSLNSFFCFGLKTQLKYPLHWVEYT
jgi:hypothetical protein